MSDRNDNWYEWQIEAVKNDMDKMAPDELANYILDMHKAINYSDSALRGEYPWFTHGRTTAKEAREIAFRTVEITINKYSEKFRKYNAR